MENIQILNSNSYAKCISTPPRNRGGVIFSLQFCVRVSVCLSVSDQTSSQTYAPILIFAKWLFATLVLTLLYYDRYGDYLYVCVSQCVSPATLKSLYLGKQ